MPSAPPSASATAIVMAPTRTVAAACAMLSKQAATASQKQHLHKNLCAEGVPAPTEANGAGLLKWNRSYAGHSHIGNSGHG